MSYIQSDIEEAMREAFRAFCEDNQILDRNDRIIALGQFAFAVKALVAKQ